MRHGVLTVPRGNILAVVALCATLLGCAHVEVKDSEWCGIPYGGGGQCYHTLTTDSEAMTQDEFLQWLTDPRVPKMCTTADTFAAWKELIEQFCSFTQSCRYDLTPEGKTKVEPVVVPK